jgi:hypothetical protein
VEVDLPRSPATLVQTRGLKHGLPMMKLSWECEALVTFGAAYPVSTLKTNYFLVSPGREVASLRRSFVGARKTTFCDACGVAVGIFRTGTMKFPNGTCKIPLSPMPPLTGWSSPIWKPLRLSCRR